MDVTNVINMNVYTYNQDHFEHYCRHGRTMILMYQATGQQHFLQQARLDMMRAKSIKAGFIRPLGVLLAS